MAGTYLRRGFGKITKVDFTPLMSFVFPGIQPMDILLEPVG